MRSGKKVLKRPRCKTCGERLYQIHGPFGKTPFGGKMPSHCPQCGAELSLDTKNRLKEHDNYLITLWCLYFVGIFIAFFIVIIVFFAF